VLLYAVLTSGCAQDHDAKPTNDFQSQVDALAAKLAKGEITKMEVLQIPASVLTQGAVTPEKLERAFFYKLTIRDVRYEPLRPRLAKAAQSVRVQPDTDMTDLRWGVIFYGLDGARVGAVYFDRWGTRGAVGDSPVSFKGDFFKWLSGTFSGCFG
jgi:hypothetical protein